MQFKIKRIDSDKDMSVFVKHISLEHEGEEYTITPDIRGLRILKGAFSGSLKIIPCCGNEIIVK